jgi:hypothetical protein
MRPPSHGPVRSEFRLPAADAGTVRPQTPQTHRPFAIAPLLLSLSLFLGSWSQPARAAGAGIAHTPTQLNDAVAGAALAADLRDAKPVTASNFKGILKIRRPDGVILTLPLMSRIVPGDKSVLTSYQVTSSNWTETLVVRHAHGLPNEYRYGRTEGGRGETNLPPLCSQIWQPFAGSDFLLADLGLEFFHWPTQVLIMNEMRKSRACHVLESRPAVPNEYARVVSWVDTESGGLLMAEAYNARNQRLKEFEVKRFKIATEQLQEIEMRHFHGGVRTNYSRTVLEFDVPGT